MSMAPVEKKEIMSVYVDALRSCFRSDRWPYDQSAHLFADTVTELHRFAQSIGLRQAWFQNKLDFPHYDLTSSKRLQAVRAGAITVETRYMVDFMHRRRAKRNGNARS